MRTNGNYPHFCVSKSKVFTCQTHFLVSVSLNAKKTGVTCEEPDDLRHLFANGGAI